MPSLAEGTRCRVQWAETWRQKILYDLPKTVDAAKVQLNNNISKIDSFLKSPELGAVELEEIHEISYSLEASVDKIKEAQNVDDLDEAVQASN